VCPGTVLPSPQVTGGSHSEWQSLSTAVGVMLQIIDSRSLQLARSATHDAQHSSLGARANSAVFPSDTTPQDCASSNRIRMASELLLLLLLLLLLQPNDSSMAATKTYVTLIGSPTFSRESPPCTVLRSRLNDCGSCYRIRATRRES